MSFPGDEAEFAALFERHRRELHVHCGRGGGAGAAPPHGEAAG